MTFIRTGDANFGKTIKPLLSAKTHIGVERAPTPRESVLFFLERIRRVISKGGHSAVAEQKEEKQEQEQVEQDDGDVVLSMLNVGCVMRDVSGNRLNLDAPLDMYWSSADPANIYACVAWNDGASAAEKDGALAGVYPIDLTLLTQLDRGKTNTAFVSDYP